MVDFTARGFVDRAMDRKALQVADELRLGLLDLAIISRIAPMLGYLGSALSVLAVVHRAVRPPDNWIVPVAVSRGLYLGLIPILLGTLVGMLAQIVGRYLERKADFLTMQIVRPEPEITIVAGVLGFVQRAMQRKAKLVGLELDRRLHHLLIIASTAPLLGLFLTLWMIGGCFPSIGGSRSSLVFYILNCLGDNLFWTLAGLSIAIMASFAYRLLLAQSDALKAETASVSYLVLNHLSKLGPYPNKDYWAA